MAAEILIQYARILEKFREMDGHERRSRCSRLGEAWINLALDTDRDVHWNYGLDIICRFDLLEHARILYELERLHDKRVELDTLLETSYQRYCSFAAEGTTLENIDRYIEGLRRYDSNSIPLAVERVRINIERNLRDREEIGSFVDVSQIFKRD